MNRQSLFFNPFTKIAGWQALLWGLAGLVISAIIGYAAKTHYHGMLNFGIAFNNSAWLFFAERFVVWLVPAIILYIAGLIFSKSGIRPVDVFGTMAFAQLPLIAMNPLTMPIMKMGYERFINSTKGLPDDSNLFVTVILSIFLVLFLVMALIWMFNAAKVSCNLKGWKLWVSYLLAIIGGDVLCRIIISAMY